MPKSRMVWMVIAGLLYVLGSCSLDDADLLAVDRDENRQDQHQALHDVLEIGVEADDVHPVREYGDDERAKDRALDAPDAPGQRRAAHDHSGDRVQLKSFAKLRGCSHGARALKKPGHPAEQTRQHEDQDLRAINTDAAQVGDTLSPADR